MARHNKIGEIGEEIAAKWLKSKGFQIVEVNYRKKWGEIDIVARERSGNLHFIEVKSVSYETRSILNKLLSHETWRPEENVHRNKVLRLKRTVKSWLIEQKYRGDWQIDVLSVRLVPHEKYSTVEFMENVIFD